MTTALNGFGGTMSLRNINSMKLLDTVTRELVAETTQIKSAPFNMTVDENYATGGVGNSRGAVYKSNKNISIPVNSAYFKKDLLAKQMGESVVEVTTVSYEEVLSVTVADSVVLGKTPATGGGITVIEVPALNNPQTIVRTFTKVESSPSANEYSISGTAITFGTGDVDTGSFIRVVYDVTTSRAIDVLSAKSNLFAGVYTVILDVAVQDAVTAKNYLGQIEIYKGSVSDTVTFNFANDGEVAVHDFEINALVNITNNELYTFKIFNDEDL